MISTLHVRTLGDSLSSNPTPQALAALQGKLDDPNGSWVRAGATYVNIALAYGVKRDSGSVNGEKSASFSRTPRFDISHCSG
jgi:hypothetical protein